MADNSEKNNGRNQSEGDQKHRRNFKRRHWKDGRNRALPNETAVNAASSEKSELSRHEVVSEGRIEEPYAEDPVSAFVSPAPDPELKISTVEVIGVRFRESGKIYYFSPNGNEIKKDTPVIVETARGVEFGIVCMPNTFVPEATVVKPLKPIVRLATEDDVRRHDLNKHLEKDAAQICEKKIAERGLEMKLVDVEYTFDNNKLIFYFTADGRVDFRELVKDLAVVFKTRIELRQIGIRDEAKILGGLGICGREFCCSSFLSDFAQVSIKMAKDQNLSLNSAKISGTCGRLICCLKYENDIYEEEIKKTPPVDSIVRCQDGDEGVVVDTSPLAGLIKVRLADKNDTVIKLMAREDVEVIGKMKKGEAKAAHKAEPAGKAESGAKTEEKQGQV